ASIKPLPPDSRSQSANCARSRRYASSVLRASPSLSQSPSEKRSSRARSASPMATFKGSDRAFMRQEPALDAELEAFLARSHEAAERAARRHHAVAWHDDGNGIGAARPPDRAGRGAELAREVSVGARLPAR